MYAVVFVSSAWPRICVSELLCLPKHKERILKSNFNVLNECLMHFYYINCPSELEMYKNI